VRLVGDGSLGAPVAWRGPLTRIGDAAQALLARTVSGKAVLDIARSRP
jgi:NADPH:quinone reductase